MTRRFLLLSFAFLSITLHASAQTLVMPDSKQVVRFDVSMQGEESGARWSAFLNEWRQYFDTNDDGKLTAAEAGRIFPLHIPGKAIAFDFKRADTNGDGIVSPAELRDFYRAAGFTPILTVVEPVSLRNQQLAEALFKHLGPDTEGVLRLAQFQRAAELLRKLDENEDEVLTPTEVLSRGGDAALKTTARSDFAWSVDQMKTPTIRLAIDPASNFTLRVDTAGNVFTRLVGNRVRHPLAMFAFNETAFDYSKAATTSRQFVLAQFKSIIGKNEWIEKRHVADDASLQLLADIFSHADRNQDGKLTLTELTRFLTLVEHGVACQVLLTLDDHGRNLFLNLDSNADGKLDYRELSSAATQVAALGGKSGWTRQQVPHCVHIRVQLGYAPEAFGPIPLTSPIATAKASLSKRSPKGPAWFQAMDKNGDGFLSPREFLGPVELFRKLDRDGDRMISVEEAEQLENSKRRID